MHKNVFVTGGFAMNPSGEAYSAPTVP